MPPKLLTLALAPFLVAGCCMGPGTTDMPDAALVAVTIGRPASGELGALVCSPTPLHACRAGMTLHQGDRVYPSVDVEASSACATQEASARAACGADLTAESTLRCLAEHGVFLDRFATFGPRDDDRPYASPSFRIECREGYARIDVMDPI